MDYLEIEKVIGREIIDSRGNPTVEAEYILQMELLDLVQHRVEHQRENLRLLN